MFHADSVHIFAGCQLDTCLMLVLFTLLPGQSDRRQKATSHSYKISAEPLSVKARWNHVSCWFCSYFAGGQLADDEDEDMDDAPVQLEAPSVNTKTSPFTLPFYPAVTSDDALTGSQ